MTIMEMLNQGNIMQLSIMGAIIIGWLLMIHTLAKGVEAKFAAADKKELAMITGTGKSAEGAITAAITAAVTEYRKSN